MFKQYSKNPKYSLFTLLITFLLPLTLIEIARNYVDDWFLMSAEAPLKQVPMVLAILLTVVILISWNAFKKLATCSDKSLVAGKVSLAIWGILSLFYLCTLSFLNLINLVIWLK